MNCREPIGESQSQPVSMRVFESHCMSVADKVWPRLTPKPDSNKKLLAFTEWLIREAAQDADVNPSELSNFLAKVICP